MDRRKKNDLIERIPYIGIGVLLIAIAIVLFVYRDLFFNSVMSKNINVGVGETYEMRSRYNANSVDLDNYQFYSSDEDIATVDENTGVLFAKKSGEVTITVKSKKSKTTVDRYHIYITAVIESTGTIQYSEESYSCGIGDVIDTLITTNEGFATIREFRSSNSAVATVELGTTTGIVPNCSNCMAVHITCKKEGKVTLSATSSTGATTTSTVQVGSSGKGWIKFEQSSYVCTAGETFDTMIKAGGTTGSIASGIKDYKSNNTNIATISEGTSSGNYTNCIDCKAVHVTCKKAGTVSLSATSTTGATTTSSVQVVSLEKGWIKYDKSSYSCKPGQVIDTTIRTGGTGSGILSRVKSFSSSNASIATVEIGTSTGAVTNCIDCQAVHITCKSEGTVTLNATSSTGATSTASVQVESENKGWIQYSQSSYSCKAGQVIDTMIKAGVNGGVASVRSFNSNNTSIATVEMGTSTGAVTNCIDCTAVHITCKKEGTVTLSATSSTGATTTSTVTVSAPDKGWVKYTQTSYTCKVGQQIDTMIKAGGTSSGTIASVKGFSSSNTTVATIENGTTTGAVTNCIDCRAVHITCKKEGTATLSATSSTGASGTATVKVEAADKGWIKYEQTNYNCQAGQVIDTMITAGGTSSGTIASVKNYSSSDTSIATIENGTSGGAVTNCYNCRAVHITCKKAGNVTLSATSSTGATTTASVKVSTPAETISFTKSSYTCYVGDVFDTMIRANGTSMPATVAGFSSNNPSIADIALGTTSGAVTNCIDCSAVHVTCKKAGTTTLVARTGNGVKGTATVTVKKR